MPDNQFYLMRHGQSVANVQGLIISHPDLGIAEYGLTEIGAQQVRESVDRLLAQSIQLTRIVTSDFRRTIETATIAGHCGNVAVEVSSDLRERYFGSLDGRSNQLYDQVWRRDRLNEEDAGDDVESAHSVAERMCRAIDQLDQASENEVFLIVSHGDPLQILMAVKCGMQPTDHRDLPPLQTAEIRSLPTSANG